MAAIQQIASRTNLALVWQQSLPRAGHESHGRTQLRRWLRQERHQASGCPTQDSAPDGREGGSGYRRRTSPLPPESRAAPNQHHEIWRAHASDNSFALIEPPAASRQPRASLQAGGRADIEKWASRSTPAISGYAAAVSSSAPRLALSITVGTVSRSSTASIRRPMGRIAGLAISATVAVCNWDGRRSFQAGHARIIPLPTSCAKSKPGRVPREAEVGSGVGSPAAEATSTG